MRVEVQSVVTDVVEDIVEISEKEIADAIKNSKSNYNMSREEAIEFIATQKLEDKYMYEYEDLEVDYVRILE